MTLNKRKNSPFRAHKTKDKREIDRRTIEYHPEMPEDFSDGLKDLLNGLLNKKPAERLGNGGAKDIMVSEDSLILSITVWLFVNPSPPID